MSVWSRSPDVLRTIAAVVPRRTIDHKLAGKANPHVAPKSTLIGFLGTSYLNSITWHQCSASLLSLAARSKTLHTSTAQRRPHASRRTECRPGRSHSPWHQIQEQFLRAARSHCCGHADFLRRQVSVDKSPESKTYSRTWSWTTTSSTIYIWNVMATIPFAGWVKMLEWYHTPGVLPHWGILRVPKRNPSNVKWKLLIAFCKHGTSQTMQQIVLMRKQTRLGRALSGGVNHEVCMATCKWMSSKKNTWSSVRIQWNDSISWQGGLMVLVSVRPPRILAKTNWVFVPQKSNFPKPSDTVISFHAWEWPVVRQRELPPSLEFDEFASANSKHDIPRSITPNIVKTSSISSSFLTLAFLSTVPYSCC